MTAELTVLALAALLQAAHWVALAIVANVELGHGVTMGPRDDSPVLSKRLGRLYRAFHNHYEALVLFIIAVVVTTLSGQATSFTALLAWTFLSARVLYIPAYVMGLNPWRSVAWFVGFCATVLMILAALT